MYIKISKTVNVARKPDNIQIFIPKYLIVNTKLLKVTAKGHMEKQTKTSQRHKEQNML